MNEERGFQPSTRLRRSAVVVSALFLFAPFAWLGYAFFSRARPSMHREAMPILISVAVFALIFVSYVFRVNRRLRRIVSAVPNAKSRDGQLCPYCFGTPATSSTQSRCCGNAPTSWSREQYQAWWSLVENGEIHPARAGDMPHNGSLASSAASSWASWHPGLMTYVLFATALVFDGFRSGATDAVSWILLLVPRTLLGYGIDLAGRGVGGWIGTERVCKQCSYPTFGSMSSERCPECGNAWRAAGASRRNRGPSRPRFFVVGGAVAIVGLVLMWHWSMGGGAWLRRMQPTTGLIRAATSTGSNSPLLRMTAWSELGQRTLTAQEETALFDAILDLRKTQLNLPGTEDTWVLAQMAAGNATPAQIARWRRESFEPQVELPASVRTGETLRIEIHGEHVAPLLPPACGVTVHLVGAWFDGAEPSLATTTTGAWTLDISQGRATPTIDVVSDRSGARELVIRLWLVARGYGALKQPLTWNADGTPILPADALWAEPIELRRSVVVAP